ncbi:MFS transporter [Fodinicola acaciae]|uniref:MFS transporter n=1 Tax=Fodinicola acaciae TaxID=2681555 RepID=UPI001C9E3764|nr:MFS transporter [Fodinicola acaciae]
MTVDLATGRLAPYWRVLADPVLRRVLPGYLVSALGDGMSVVAVAWLAIQISPVSERGVWTGLAVAAYALPATVGAAMLGRFVRSLPSARLMALDAILRAAALGAVAVLGATGLLRPAVYVALLAMSALLHAWGSAGAFSLVAERLTGPERVTGNAVLSTASQASVIVGPAIAGGVIALTGPAWVIGIDALTFMVLAVFCWRIPAKRAAEPTKASGLRVIAGNRQLIGLLAITCVFYFLYGPVEVALPLHVVEDMHGNAGLLGVLLAVFGVGALIGGLSTGLLPRKSPWLLVVAIIVGWGAALLPVGFFSSVLPVMLGLGFGGLIYGPYTAMSTELFQQVSPPDALTAVLATRTALVIPAVSLGTMAGGPIVNVLGPAPTLVTSAALTIGLGGILGLAVLSEPVGKRWHAIAEPKRRLPAPDETPP